MGLAMADPTADPTADPSADTAAAMLQAVRAADISTQPLAVGLADALEVLIDREYEDFVTGQFISCNAVESIINHLRANNHA